MATTFESGHLDQVHDAQLDYYGRRLATCSSDKTIKIFEVVGEQHTHLADLKGHEGPVWQVCWAHPKFGSLLASCSFDHRVIVWKEAQDNQWQQVHGYPAIWAWSELLERVNNRNCVGCTYLWACWGWAQGSPRQLRSLSQVYISPGTLHTASINSIAWAPQELGLVLAAGSSDGTVSITEYTPSTGSWDATKVSARAVGRVGVWGGTTGPQGRKSS